MALSIPVGVKQCLQNGACRLSVLRYFLASGTHVVEDIPEQVQYPDTLKGSLLCIDVIG